MEFKNYSAALKHHMQSKDKSNFMVIQLEYNKCLLLPYKDGLLLVQAMEKAEIYNNNYGKPEIRPIKTDELAFSAMSAEEYLDTKMAGLLNVDVSAIREARSKAFHEEKINDGTNSV